MTRSILIFVIDIFLFQNIQAQEGSKITVPTSPAFSILNFEPTAVMRPTNARDLAADVLNSFDKEGNLILNLGLEVAPYWLWSHPKLKREPYLEPNPGQAFLQSFSLSAATVKDSASGDNKLGAGFRFKLFNGQPLKEELAAVTNELKSRTTVLDQINAVRRNIGGATTTRQQAIDDIESNLKAAGTDPNVITTVKQQAQAFKDDYSDSPSDIKAFLEKLINIRNDAESELIKKKSDFLYERTGFILEFAGASGYNTSTNNRLERLGLWGNASYFVSTDGLFTLTARYMYQNNDTALNNFDVGLGFLKKSTPYNVSVEGMFRWYRAEIPDININNEPILRLDKDFTYRLAVQGSVMINKEFSINLSLGKDFSSPFITGSGFFSILGFNYSFFSKQPPGLK